MNYNFEGVKMENTKIRKLTNARFKNRAIFLPRRLPQDLGSSFPLPRRGAFYF